MYHFLIMAETRGVADGQVGPVLTGPLFGQTEIFSLAKVYFTQGGLIKPP